MIDFCCLAVTYKCSLSGSRPFSLFVKFTGYEMKLFVVLLLVHVSVDNFKFSLDSL
jgi:hypothetical protein